MHDDKVHCVVVAHQLLYGVAALPAGLTKVRMYSLQLGWSSKLRLAITPTVRSSSEASWGRTGMADAVGILPQDPVGPHPE